MSARRTWLFGFLILGAGVPAAAFIAGGIAKLQDPYLAARFIATAFRAPLDTGFAIVRPVACCEIVLGTLLCVCAGKYRTPAYVSLCVLAFFLGLITRVWMTHPGAATCGCFGSLMGESLRKSWGVQMCIDSALFVLLCVHLLAGRVLCSSPTFAQPRLARK